MIKHLFDAVEVKIVGDVVLVDLAEELMILQIAKPTNPALAVLRAVIRTLRHPLFVFLIFQLYVLKTHSIFQIVDPNPLQHPASAP